MAECNFEHGLPLASSGRDAEALLSMLRRMLLIRRVEVRIAECVERGEIGCPCHLYIGQEAIAVGVCSGLRADDLVFSTHRNHGHYLAKGGSLDGLMREVFCRSTGCSGGWGGSMHVHDLAAGFPGSPAIVSGSIPHAVGAALAFSLRGEDRVAVAFFGDGATNEGVFYESLNLAALWNLPVVFVCENNLYSTHMHITECLADARIAERAASFGLPAHREDGNDVIAVASMSETSVTRARNGDGPTLLEYMTYRWCGHVGVKSDVGVGLRTAKELEQWKNRCPIGTLELRLVHEGYISPTALSHLHEDVENEVERCLSIARAADYPGKESLMGCTDSEGTC